MKKFSLQSRSGAFALIILALIVALLSLAHYNIVILGRLITP
jgi:hypothetical protein